MPYLPNPIPVLGLKFAGYSVAGTVLRLIYRGGINPFLFGLIRVVAGLALGFITLPFVAGSLNERAFFIWLLSIRLVVWGALVWLFFERKRLKIWRFVVVVALGSCWSFALDKIFEVLMGLFPDFMQVPFC